MQVQILPETICNQVDNIVIVYYNIDINKNYSSIAQLVEQGAVNSQVTGSSPVRGAILQDGAVGSLLGP